MNKLCLVITPNDVHSSIYHLLNLPPLAQVSYLLEYGELPSRTELSRWDDALRRHSALPVSVWRPSFWHYTTSAAPYIQ